MFGCRVGWCCGFRSSDLPPVHTFHLLPSSFAAAQPGKKGVALSPDEWDKLCAAAPLITQHLQAGGSQAGGSAAAAAAAGAGSSGKAAARGAAGAAGAAPAAAAAGGGGGGVELSGSRRADVSTFKGTTYVSIREFYEKVGAGVE